MADILSEIMPSKKDLIDKIRRVYKEKGLSYAQIISIAEENGDYVSKSILSRLFTEGSTDYNFRYEETLRPIAKVLLDMETIEETDDTDVQAMKSLLKFKIKKIEELERELDSVKVKHHEKLEKEREQSRRSIDFLKDQITLKDQRIDALLNSLIAKDDQIKALLDEIVNCPRRKECFK